jgi:PAS domain S-box-containing protein
MPRPPRPKRPSGSSEAQLSQARLAAIIDSSDDVIVSKTLDGVITSWNPAAERMFGWTAEEAVGQHITMIVPADRRAEEDEVLARLRRGERIDHFETVRITKDRRLLDVSITVSPIRDATGRVVGASKIGRDITERKEVEREREQLLMRAQQARAEAEAANRAKDDFLAMLSHELRTPINAILGWAQVLGSARHDADMVDRALETITRNAKQQAHLIEDLLDVSAIMSGRLELNARPMTLVTTLGAVLESIRPEADAKQIAIRARFDPLVGMVHGDAERLQQVFWNLLSNAIKFTGREGRVDVTLERIDTRAVVTVSDTGIGIRPDVLPVIFERFRQADRSITRAHGGLGLGLAIVKQLVELHGGTVTAASSGEGRGAVFTVAIPLTSLHARPDDEEAALGPGVVEQCRDLRVLLVDDEADGRDLVTVFLEQSGARVTAVGSVGEALAAIRRSAPELVISDLAMPGTDGYELMRQVRALPIARRIPSVALTAHASADVRIKAFQAGFDAYLTKPIDRAELVAVVVRLARRSADGAGPR